MYAGGLVLQFLSQAVASENKNVWRQLSGVYLGLDQTKTAAFEDSLEDSQLSMSKTYMRFLLVSLPFTRFYKYQYHPVSV